MMNTTWKRLLYSIFILGVALFFIYYLFPSDTIKNVITSNFNATHPGANITIHHVDLLFPPGLELYDVNIDYMDDVLFKAEFIKIIPNFFSLFRSKIGFFFKGSVFKGILKGRGEFERRRPRQEFFVKGDLSDIQIKAIPAVKIFFTRKLKGLLSGKFTYRNDKDAGRRLETTLVVSDGEVELLTPIFKMDHIQFSSIEADLAMKNTSLRVKQCNLKGEQMDGSISGAVILKMPPRQSYLKLSGMIKPNPLFLESLGKDLPKNLLPKEIVNKKIIRIRIYGTVENPRFSLN